MISVTLYVEVLPLFSVINQRNLIFVKHSKHRGHETEVGVFFSAKTDDFDESKNCFTF